MDPVKAKLIELVPEIVVNPHAQLIGHDHKVTYFAETRSITLPDVLRAIATIKDPYSYGFEPLLGIDGRFYRMETELGDEAYITPIAGGEWNLSLDFDHQTDEMKRFIGKLIGV